MSIYNPVSADTTLDQLETAFPHLNWKHFNRNESTDMWRTTPQQDLEWGVVLFRDNLMDAWSCQIFHWDSDHQKYSTITTEFL